MTVGLHVDYTALSTIPEAIENCEEVEPSEAGSVVNVHANFSIPAGQEGQDMAFPHLVQMNELATKRIEQGIPMIDIGNGPKILPIFPDRPNFLEEWKKLKKAWSLHRRDRLKLSQKHIREASEAFYKQEPLSDINDWLWRFVMKLGGAKFEPTFLEAYGVIQPLIDDAKFRSFIDYYSANMSSAHGGRYFEVMREYFSGYSDYSQIFFQVREGLEIDESHNASSVNFHSTRMFYGNAYEAFMSSVDVLAYLNNMIDGREFDQFQQLTLEQYQALDKAGRCNPFGENSAFSNLCEERDNQLRNASHHGSFVLDVETQVIDYRSGRGGSGPVRSLAYIKYLERSTSIFLQIMTLFRIEIMMCHHANSRFPL